VDLGTEYPKGDGNGSLSGASAIPKGEYMPRWKCTTELRSTTGLKSRSLTEFSRW
jgi:hypothetical protein